MDIREVILGATESVTILGLLPLADWLSGDISELERRFRSDPPLRLTCLYESESELFFASLITDHRTFTNRISFVRLREMRNRALRALEACARRAGRMPPDVLV